MMVVLTAAIIFAQARPVAAAEPVEFPTFATTVQATINIEAKVIKTARELLPLLINTTQNKAEAAQPEDVLGASMRTTDYRPVPPEDKNPIEWVDPFQNKERQVVRWKPIIDAVLATGDYPNADAMIIMGIIAQETGGDPNVEGCDFNNLGDACGVGVMAIAPQSWTGTKAQLMNPTYNIGVGISMYNTIYNQALEHGYRPGREATRAALAAYNCGWKSVLADKCYSFGGFTYSDKVMNYWIPLLQIYLGDAHEN